MEVHPKTIRRRISESGEFSSYWKIKKPFVSAKNRRIRVQWCKDHLHWTQDDWNKVLWSDESPFVYKFDGKTRVWRKHNERYHVKAMKGTVKHDKKINVWGCFSARGVGMLCMVPGIMEQQQYRDILEDYMVPSGHLLFGASEEGVQPWIFQQDNDPKHTAHATIQWFEDNNINKLVWPSQSPDLNPIENLWSYLNSVTRKRDVYNDKDLFKALSKGWKELPTWYLTNLIDSMPRRLRAVIDNGGYPTKY